MNYFRAIAILVEESWIITREKFWFVVGAVPGDVFDAGIFGVVDFAAELGHGSAHALGFGDGNDVVIGAVENPHGNFADFLAASV